MARDTDRKKISEAVRLSRSWRISHADNEIFPTGGSVTLTHTDGDELNISYSRQGRVTHVAHWQVVAGTNGCAHREPISHHKREYVLMTIEASR